MNQTSEKTGTPYAIVCVGGEPLLHFPTSQQAWDYLRELLEFESVDNPLPEETYILFVIEMGALGVQIPQIQKVVKENGDIKARGLFGADYEKFQYIKDDWPRIKEGLESRKSQFL